MIVARFVIRNVKGTSLLDRRYEGRTLNSVVLQFAKDIRNYRQRSRKDGKDLLLRWRRIEAIIEKNGEIKEVPKVTLLGKEFDA